MKVVQYYSIFFICVLSYDQHGVALAAAHSVLGPLRPEGTHLTLAWFSSQVWCETVSGSNLRKNNSPRLSQSPPRTAARTPAARVLPPSATARCVAAASATAARQTDNSSLQLITPTYTYV